MKSIRWCLPVVFVLLLLSLCACSEKETALNGASDPYANHPAKAYAGTYTEAKSGQGSVEVLLAENDAVYLVVRWNTASNETVLWNMSGVFDAEKSTVLYENCFKTVEERDENGGSQTEVVYQDGHGSFVFDGESLTWNDAQEHIADGMTFVII